MDRGDEFRSLLKSCKALNELKRLMSHYETLSELFGGLPDEPRDSSLAVDLKNKCTETEYLLRELTIETAEAEHLKTELNEMLDNAKGHIWQNINNFVPNISLQSTNRGAASVNSVGTASRNVVESIDGTQAPPSAPDSSDAPSALKDLVVSSDVDPGNAKNLRPEPTKETKVAKSEPAMTVTLEQFRRAPDHIRGRITVAKLNGTLIMLREVMIDKYRLLEKRRGLTDAERNATMRMRSEIVPALSDTHFISKEDIFFFKEKKLSKVMMNHLIVLRHLHKIREVRDGNLLRIILEN